MTVGIGSSLFYHCFKKIISVKSYQYPGSFGVIVIKIQVSKFKVDLACNAPKEKCADLLKKINSL